MRRREFITLLGGAAVSWPGGVRAQQNGVRRIGVLVAAAENDADIEERLAGFLQRLESLGWSNGRNLRADIHYAASRADRYPALAKELVASQPDVILGHSTPIVVALQRETRAVPVVFVSVSDPVGSGVVASLARPGSNMTGVLQYEAGITGKWLAMLKEIAPQIARAAFLANPKTTAMTSSCAPHKAWRRRSRLSWCPRLWRTTQQRSVMSSKPSRRTQMAACFCCPIARPCKIATSSSRSLHNIACRLSTPSAFLSRPEG
jgi:ABC-type uncharacterized transport system substrate-binding protein